MRASRFWKCGERACNSYQTTAITLFVLKLCDYVPAIEWSTLLFIYISATVGAILTGAAAAYYEDQERQSTATASALSRTIE